MTGAERKHCANSLLMPRRIASMSQALPRLASMRGAWTSFSFGARASSTHRFFCAQTCSLARFPPTPTPRSFCLSGPRSKGRLHSFFASEASLRGRMPSSQAAASCQCGVRNLYA